MKIEDFNTDALIEFIADHQAELTETLREFGIDAIPDIEIVRRAYTLFGDRFLIALFNKIDESNFSDFGGLLLKWNNKRQASGKKPIFQRLTQSAQQKQAQSAANAALGGMGVLTTQTTKQNRFEGFKNFFQKATGVLGAVTNTAQVLNNQVVNKQQLTPEQQQFEYEAAKAKEKQQFIMLAVGVSVVIGLLLLVFYSQKK